MSFLTSKWRKELYNYEKNYENFQLKISLNILSNATDNILNGLTKLRLCLKHDDQHMTETGNVSGINTNEQLLL